MTRKMRSYVKGLILSLCGKPLPLTAQKEPVAYLYNGVRLPALPEWDREAYPYAMIFDGASTLLSGRWTYGLWLSQYPIEVYYDADSNVYRWKNADESEVWSLYAVKSLYANWKDIYTDDAEPQAFHPSINSMEIIWANHDVVNTDDNTVYLAASEPVPTVISEVVQTLFDGAATTSATEDGTAYKSEAIDYVGTLETAGAWRITFGTEVTVTDMKRLSFKYQCGNAYLDGSGESEDNGGDWCLQSSSTFATTEAKLYLYTRAPGTYRLKIEQIYKEV